MTDLIQNLWPSLIPHHPHIATLQPISKSRHHTVWKVITSDQHTFVIKHHLFASLTQGKPYDLIAVEKKVTSLLLKEGVSIPQIIATQAQQGLTIYTWCGTHTLDGYIQQNNPSTIAPKVLHAILTLEVGFSKHIAPLQSHIAPGTTQQDTLTSFNQITDTLTNALPHLIKIFTPHSPSQIQTHWQNILTHINQTSLSIGPTDFNARNIVLSNTHTPYLLELAKIGYDWPEKRLIQYTTSLGAHLPNGQIIGLLTPQLAQTYAHEASKYRPENADHILTNLDMHHLIFYLLAALQCLQAHNTPNHPWQNIDTRLQNIQTALSTPLSQNPSTHFIRHLFQT